MQHISLTPFGRQPLTAAHLAAVRLAEAPAPLAEIDKFALLRDLTAARVQLGVTDRDLTVLAALLSFLPGKLLQDGAALVVYPSNAALSDRAHGMAESTLRRHLAALARAGLMARRDSPNGKRYAVRGPEGTQAFGFDLRPLLVSAPGIMAAADAARTEGLRLRRLREVTVVRLRDAGKLAEWAGGGNGLSAQIGSEMRALRRRLSPAETERLAAVAQSLLDRAKSLVVVAETEEMHGNDSQNGRHHLNSTAESQESEPCQERQEREADGARLPLGLVLKAAPDIVSYAPHGIRSWRDLMAVAAVVRPCLGISPEAWAEAQRLMGPEVAAVAVAAMLQRSDQIRSPGGYLRSLSSRAAAGDFSPGPMIMALLRAEDRRSA